MIEDERPEWHHRAPCRGDERWLVERQTAASVAELRSVCRSCPVSGSCLREAMALDQMVRHYGVLRVGTSGWKAWGRVDKFVAELSPVTDADFDVLAAWIVDGDLEPGKVRRNDTAADNRRRAVELHAAGMRPKDIAVELGVHWTAAFRYLRTA